VELLTIICETAFDETIHGLLDRVGAPGFTRFSGVTGAGETGRREGTVVWPGRNTIFLAAMEEVLADEFVTGLRDAIADASRVRKPAVRVFSEKVVVRI
jgi:hypothetical protein